MQVCVIYTFPNLYFQKLLARQQRIKITRICDPLWRQTWEVFPVDLNVEWEATWACLKLSRITLLNNYSLNLYAFVSTCLYVHLVCAVLLDASSVRSPELEFQVVLSLLIQVLGIEPNSFVRVISVFNPSLLSTLAINILCKAVIYLYSKTVSLGVT